MHLVYFVILSVLAKNIDGYNTNRQPRVSTADSVFVDNFPEVEYPSSITDTTKPFYLNANPFSSDVQSSFKSLTPGGATKATPTIILNLKSSDNSKDKNKHKLVTSGKAIPNREKTITAVEITANDTKTNDNTIILNFKNNSGLQETNKEFTSRPEKESSNSEEIEYVLGVIDNFDDFITTTANSETEVIGLTNTTAQIFDDDEHQNEIETITSDVKSVNNFVVESNERSSHTETSLFNELTNNSTVATWLVNGGLTDSSVFNDTKTILALGIIPNDTDWL